jgi:RNA polymerase sigma-70 factor (ECF subfamily)
MGPWEYLMVGIAIGAVRGKDHAPGQKRRRDWGDVAAAARGDQRALGRLYDRYAHLVYSLAQRILDDPHEAEEVTQNVFLRLWHCAGAFDHHRGDLIAWLLAVTRNRALDQLRARLGREDDHWVPMPESPDDHLWLTSQPAISYVEATKRLSKALAEMSSPQRKVLEMAFFEGYTESEIAEMLQAPITRVMTWNREALDALWRAMPS